MRYADEFLEIEGRKVKLARSISRLTPAPLFNFYVGLIISLTSPIGLGPILDSFWVMLFCIIFMVILPVTPIIFQAWKGVVDLDVSKQDVRMPFFLFAILCYIAAYIVFGITSCHVMQVLAAAYVTVTTAVMIATRWTKVSVHCAGTAGPGTALIIMYSIPALLVVLVWIAVVWSRTFLKQHSWFQSIAGIFLAVLVTAGTYFFLW